MEDHRSRKQKRLRVATTRGPGGYVYVMDNPSMPGIVKIGMTRRTPGVRLEELSSATGVPTPFRLCYYAKTKDCAWAEERVHYLLRKKRVNRNREFFKISPEDAFKVIKKVASSPVRKGSGALSARTRLIVSGAVFLSLCLVQAVGVLHLPGVLYRMLPNNTAVWKIDSVLYHAGLNSQAVLLALAGSLLVFALTGKQTDRRRTRGRRRHSYQSRRRR